MTKTEKLQDVNARLKRAEKRLFKRLQKTLKDYQLEGVKWMLNHEKEGHGGLLGDEPGLGKTYQALSLIISHHKSVNLVVVPASTLPQWTRESRILCGEDRVYVHHGSARDKLLPEGTRVVLTTPDTLRRSGYLYTKKPNYYLDLHVIDWDRIIVDEVHCIKNHKSESFKCFTQLKSNLKWGLSGTPIQNNTREIKNLFSFVTNTNPSDPLPDSLDNLINSRLLRRKKQDKLDLKPIEIENVTVTFKSKKERKFYQKVQKNIRRDLINMGNGAPGEQMAILMELLIRLRQTSQHPQLVIEGFRRKLRKEGLVDDPNGVEAREKIPDWSYGPSSKHLSLLEMISEHPNDKTLVFCKFTKEMDILEELLKTNSYRVARLDGSMSQTQRTEVLQNCVDYNLDGIPISGEIGETIKKKIRSYLSPDILLIQIDAGGVGLNLQSFNRVYISSPDYNPANEDQAIARCWRLGQKKRVYVKRLVLQDMENKTDDNTPDLMIDRRILQIQEQKRKLHAKLLNDESLSYNGKWKTASGAGLSIQQFKQLLR